MKGLSERNLYLRYADAARIRTLVTRDLGRGVVGISRIRCDFDDLGMLDPPDREDANLVVLRLSDAQEDLWVDGRHVATPNPLAGMACVLDYRQEWRAYLHTRFDALNFHVPRAALKALDGDEHRRAAKALMLRPGLSLAEIAVQRGFSDQSHFTRAFRRIVGVTPSAWRRDRPPRASPA